MHEHLDELASLLPCPRCRASAWEIVGRDNGNMITCSSCLASYRCDDGVLDLTETDEDPRVSLEREGVRRTERNPELGGINDEFDDLSRADGALKEAILALPYGNDSRYYREQGYFANVRTSIAAFDFLVRHLDVRAGERLLDLGADLTWSTCHMARRGLRCTALDINHHLAVGRLFATHYQVSYNLVRADMRRVGFRDNAFDIVLAVNALHHSDPIGEVAANIARMLRPGGRLGLIEPYCADEAGKAAFGRAQIEAGISEQTYLLREWHEAFTHAGLDVQVSRVCDSFSAVYRKPGDVTHPITTPDPRSDLFAGFYRGRLSVADAPPRRVVPFQVFELPLLIENRSDAVWCSISQFPVRASYHLYRLDDGANTTITFDNARSPLPAELGPGEKTTTMLTITAPGEPGDYAAEIDLVQEYVSWFASKGMQPVTVRFSVDTPEQR
jgi:2-polyprenyl-3-methyl-5-hydroxy-6-metoxy-1,4-benzoquinol methylase